MNNEEGEVEGVEWKMSDSLDVRFDEAQAVFSYQSASLASVSLMNKVFEVWALT